MVVPLGSVDELADYSWAPNPGEFPLGSPQLLDITSKHKEKQKKKTHDLKKLFFWFKSLIDTLIQHTQHISRHERDPKEEESLGFSIL